MSRRAESSRVRVAGIDVGGAAKGFHLAIQDPQDGLIAIHQASEPAQILKYLKHYGVHGTIAIDCPSSPFVKGSSTREAERALVRKGYRIQWTRRKDSGVKPQEWMLNGERVWKALRRAGFVAIETFPTAISDQLADSKDVLPIRLLAGRELRAEWKDYLDACLCALVARAHLQGRAVELEDGPGKLGSIWLLA